MEMINTKSKLVLALFLMALLLSGAQGGRYVPEKQSEALGNNQQLFGWFGFPHFGFGWPFFKGFGPWGPFPVKTVLNKQNTMPRTQTTGDAGAAASTMFP